MAFALLTVKKWHTWGILLRRFLCLFDNTWDIDHKHSVYFAKTWHYDCWFLTFILFGWVWNDKILRFDRSFLLEVFWRDMPAILFFTEKLKILKQLGLKLFPLFTRSAHENTDSAWKKTTVHEKCFNW